ncbi:preprotein translocase subunit SecG [Elusimicrobium posterum]|uniref:preprotein translocase subunit SecG n=1 Tax=Elusimicrobium posterum TaxID=3116653 RepID=UPI003C78ADB4
MYTAILVVHFIACVLLILSVLMQSGKGSAAGIFGGSAGGGDNLFAGPTAFNILNKFTIIVAAVIFCTSVSLTLISDKRGSRTLTDNIPMSATQTAGQTQSN